MMIFSTWVEYFNLHSSETLIFTLIFKNVFGFFTSFFDQKATAFQRRLNIAKILVK